MGALPVQRQTAQPTQQPNQQITIKKQIDHKKHAPKKYYLFNISRWAARTRQSENQKTKPSPLDTRLSPLPGRSKCVRPPQHSEPEAAGRSMLLSTGPVKGGGPQADGHGGRSPPSGHWCIVDRPFEGAARNRSTRVVPDHRGELHVTNCEAPSPHAPELGAREAHRASPTGLPFVPRLSNGMRLMVLEVLAFRQPDAQEFTDWFLLFYTCYSSKTRPRKITNTSR